MWHPGEDRGVADAVQDGQRRCWRWSDARESRQRRCAAAGKAATERGDAETLGARGRVDMQGHHATAAATGSWPQDLMGRVACGRTPTRPERFGWSLQFLVRPVRDGGAHKQRKRRNELVDQVDPSRRNRIFIFIKQEKSQASKILEENLVD